MINFEKIFCMLSKYTSLDADYFFRNSFWLVLRQVSVVLSGLIISIVLARTFTTEEYGQYQYILALFSLLSFFAIPGLFTSFFRSVALKHEGDYFSVIKRSVSFSALGFFSILAFGIFYYLHKSQELGLIILASSLLFPFYHSFIFWIALLDGKKEFKRGTYWKTIHSFIVTFSVLSSVFFTNIFLTLFLFLVSNIILNFVWSYKAISLITNSETHKDTINYGYQLTKIGFLGGINSQFDKLIIGFLNIKVLAIYAIALQLIDVIKSSLKALFSILMPKLVHTNVKIKPIHIFVLSLLGILLSGILALISKYLILVLYGGQYIEAYKIINILSYLVILYVLIAPLGIKVSATKNIKAAYITTFFIPFISIITSVTIFLVTDSILYLIVSKLYTTQLLTAIFLYVEEFSN